MLRGALILILLIVVAHAFWRMMDGVLDGLSGRARTGSQRGIHMVRDPVCGTFVVPERAVAIEDGSRRVFFCSTTCREKYRSGNA